MSEESVRTADTGSPDGRSPDTYDVVVLGAGSGGEIVAEKAAQAGLGVAVVEAGLVGGECPFLACVPSKAMLLAATAFRRAGGDAAAAWRDAVARRDEAAQHQDDGGHAGDLEKAGAVLVRGTGRLTGRHEVEVDGRTLRWTRALVVGTGSAPSAPPVEGLDRVPTWTSDEALTSPERPARLAVLGGGAVGCELAQVYASFGVEVTLVEAGPRLLGPEDGWVGELLATALRENGVDVRTDVAVERAEATGDGARLHLADGTSVECDRVLVAAGRTPRTGGIGLEHLGLEPDGPLEVDARCHVRAGDGVLDDVYAVGDVTGVAPYTHTASYQARLAAADLLGHGRDGDFSAIPRSVYTEPAVWSVGLSESAAAQQGTPVRSADFDVTQTARAFLEGQDGDEPAGARLRLVVDDEDRLVGAAAVGPAADSWAGELALAVKLRLPVATLEDLVHAFPTWAEAVQPPAEELAGRG